MSDRCAAGIPSVGVALVILPGVAVVIAFAPVVVMMTVTAAAAVAVIVTVGCDPAIFPVAMLTSASGIIVPVCTISRLWTGTIVTCRIAYVTTRKHFLQCQRDRKHVSSGVTVSIAEPRSHDFLSLFLRATRLAHIFRIATSMLEMI